jgi:hypothetical protein
MEVFWLLSQPLTQLRFNHFVISEIVATQLWTASRNKHFPPYTGNVSLWIWSALNPFAYKTRITELCSSVVHPSSTVAFLLLKPASKYAHELLLHTLSLSRTVLLPSDKHRKPITSIIAVLLAFVAYLLTLLVLSNYHCLNKNHKISESHKKCSKVKDGYIVKYVHHTNRTDRQTQNDTPIVLNSSYITSKSRNVFIFVIINT